MDCFYSSSSKCSFHKTLVPRHLSSYIFSTVFICNAVKDILKCKSAAQSHKNIHLLFGILFENIKPLKKKKKTLKTKRLHNYSQRYRFFFDLTTVMFSLNLGLRRHFPLFFFFSLNKVMDSPPPQMRTRSPPYKIK